jgi:hypothetical protein
MTVGDSLSPTLAPACLAEPNADDISFLLANGSAYRDGTMDVEIKDRKLSTVSITSIDMDWIPQGKQMVGGMCHVGLSGPDENTDGPGANIFFGVVVDPSMPLRDVARATLTRAHEVLERMASFSIDDLERCFVEWRTKTIQQQREAASLGYPKSDHS